MDSEKTKRFSRRQFVKDAAATAGLLVVKPQSVFGARANSAPQIGLVACGGRGRFVGRFFPEHTNAKIVALSDPFEDRLAYANRMFKLEKSRLFKGLDGCKELLELDIDAVVITSRPYFHPEQVAAADGRENHLARRIPRRAVEGTVESRLDKRALPVAMCLLPFRSPAEERFTVPQSVCSFVTDELNRTRYWTAFF